MNRRGFTLLETILTLALTVVLLGLLGMAVDVHLRLADAGRNELEETQTARLLLRQMCNDLRNAIPVTRAPSSFGFLQGSQNELQVDVSCLPLLEQPQTATPQRERALPTSPPSDVRTVTYFLAKPGDVESPEGDDSHKPMHGLLRRESERATYAWAVQQGQTDQFNRDLKVLSPEVEKIEFAYIDESGTSYQEWDSLAQGKLPAAVRISVSIRRLRQKSRAVSGTGTVGQTPLTVYSALADLPNARATLDTTLAALPQQSGTSSQGTSSSDSSNKGSSSQGSSSQGSTSQGSTSQGASSQGGTTSQTKSLNSKGTSQ
jgi:hypothetical protein